MTESVSTERAGELAHLLLNESLEGAVDTRNCAATALRALAKERDARAEQLHATMGALFEARADRDRLAREVDAQRSLLEDTIRDRDRLAREVEELSHVYTAANDLIDRGLKPTGVVTSKLRAFYAARAVYRAISRPNAARERQP